MGACADPAFPERAQRGHVHVRRDGAVALHHHEHGIRLGESGEIIEARHLEERRPVVDRFHSAEGDHDAGIDRGDQRGPARGVIIETDLRTSRNGRRCEGKEHDGGERAGSMRRLRHDCLGEEAGSTGSGEGFRQVCSAG